MTIDEHAHRILDEIHAAGRRLIDDINARLDPPADLTISPQLRADYAQLPAEALQALLPPVAKS